MILLTLIPAVAVAYLVWAAATRDASRGGRLDLADIGLVAIPLLVAPTLAILWLPALAFGSLDGSIAGILSYAAANATATLGCSLAAYGLLARSWVSHGEVPSWLWTIRWPFNYWKLATIISFVVAAAVPFLGWLPLIVLQVAGSRRARRLMADQARSREGLATQIAAVLGVSSTSLSDVRIGTSSDGSIRVSGQLPPQSLATVLGQPTVIEQRVAAVIPTHTLDRDSVSPTGFVLTQVDSDVALARAVAAQSGGLLAGPAQPLADQAAAPATAVIELDWKEEGI